MNAATFQSFYLLLKKTKPPVGLLSAAVSVSVIQALAALAIPWFLKTLIDGFTVDRLTPQLISLFVIVFVVQVVANALSIYWLQIVGQRIVANLRTLLWKHLLTLSIPFYDETKSGELVSRLNSDATTLQQLLSEQLVRLLTSLVSIIGAITILFFLDWQMTLVMVIAVPVTLLIIIPLVRKLHKISRETQKELAGLSGFFAEMLGEVRLVKSQATEPYELYRGKTRIENLYGYGVKEGRIQALLLPIFNVTLTTMLILIIGFGAYRVATNQITAGELVAFSLYLFQIMTPLVTMTEFITKLQKARGATERIIELLDETPEAPGALVAPRPFTDVTVDHLSFGYNETPILQDVSFTLPRGKTTAIVGPSGSGKTTLFAILERFYQPTSGQIRLGDQSIADLTLSSWRQAIGYVAQDSPVLSGTIRDNLIYGLAEDVSEDKIREAARMANTDTFIERFPEGYATEIGERGVKLSGGQRQRIAIARALLRDPEILLLDEATSSLDSESERVVQEALERLMVGRTTFVIAHRLATVRHADQIIVLEDGRISGIGTHDRLVVDNPLYNKLVTQQFIGTERARGNHV
ncbi:MULTISPECIES: ABC transporter ATP-binding protein [unclassified Exiguobacterium]|uniref:ABC transporter ATP-binding protein n=1 Tax=unclassified Exiguobacterium TaxID=2644629 RepID=UPI001BE7A54A|nr:MULTISPECIES: ABC transporter ATP-binding protein [unclassified Exiguobacterium]